MRPSRFPQETLLTKQHAIFAAGPTVMGTCNEVITTEIHTIDCITPR